jgi:hypothetical protein
MHSNSFNTLMRAAIAIVALSAAASLRIAAAENLQDESAQIADFATCPLPPQQNQLALAIDAGELKYERAH